ncbi:MAG TPA: c-type cytochrome [Vicinamibacteria bacterium]
MRRLLPFIVTSFSSLPIAAQLPESGSELYRIGCAKCHGEDGRGVDPSLVGFTTPVPDFADCRFASREAAQDWIAVTHLGGPARGFNSSMPAFGEAFDLKRIEAIVEFLRGFCTDRAWPRGELNLPLALVTEKAFPEDEALWTTFVDVEGKGEIATELVYERRVGARHQWELTVPFGAAPTEEQGPWVGGVGDIGLGWKSALWHSPGAILTAGGEVFLPTGNEDRGQGTGTVFFEPFLAYARLLPREWFLQAQGGVEIPADPDRAETELFWRAVVGWSLSASGGFGRTWSPMLEVLGSADSNFEETDWSLLPQIQVTLSQRQHIRLNGGIEVPVTRAGDRPSRFVFYFLWDWFDGGLTDGW